MREIRVYADLPLQAGQTVTLPADAARHVSQVLRQRAGDPVVIFNGDGRDYPGTLTLVSKGGVSVALDAPGPVEAELPLRIHLGIGISKGERMDFAIQKAVELGVAQITPLFTERCVVRLSGERLAKRLQHWHGVLVAACEQSGRRHLPPLNAACTLPDWLPAAAPGLLLDHRAGHGIADTQRPAGTVSLLVGPEGGLSEVERDAARAAGFTGIRLGPRVMRTETAPLAAIAALQVLWGDMG